MNLNEYQDRAQTTDELAVEEMPDFIDPNELRLASGVADEGGEVLGKYKKALRENDEEYIEEVGDELGDVLWYVALLAEELGYTLEEVAAGNLDKLIDRRERGVLVGDGDHR